VIQRPVCEFVNEVDVLVDEDKLFSDGGFVLAHKVGRVDLEPPHSRLAQSLPLAEEEQPPRKIIADVIEMGRDGVDSPPKVEVMWEVEVVQLAEGLSNVELQEEVTPQRMLVPEGLNDLKDLLPLLGISFLLIFSHIGV
jgi:hypothetical protein